MYQRVQNNVLHKGRKKKDQHVVTLWLCTKHTTTEIISANSPLINKSK